jgi:cyclin B
LEQLAQPYEIIENYLLNLSKDYFYNQVAQYQFLIRAFKAMPSSESHKGKLEELNDNLKKLKSFYPNVHRRNTESDPQSIYDSDDDEYKEEIDGDDELAASDYIQDIFYHFREKERMEALPPTFLRYQKEITDRLRAVLINWLVDVQVSLTLTVETLYLSINIMDRFLRQCVIPRDKFLLVGIAAMFLASKYEEILPPECNDFIYISDSVCTKSEILQMERLLLTTIRFKLTIVSPLDFIRIYVKLMTVPVNFYSLCKYLHETLIMDIQVLRYITSLIAAGVIYLARAMTMQKPLWPSSLQYLTMYSTETVKCCAQYIYSFVRVTKKMGYGLDIIKKKYTGVKYHNVASLDLVEV